MSASRRAWQRGRRRRRERHEGGGGGLRTFGLGMALLALLGTFLVAGATAIAFERYRSYTSSVAPAPELIAQLPRGGARIYDRHGTLLYEFVDERAGIRRAVSLENVSPWMISATVATEDASYWDNPGINVRGLARAAWENFSPAEGELFEGSGGSSITQQLAKNLYIPREERAERTIERKLKEAAIAIELNRRYSKEQILEWYLNTISYGGVYVGIEAAAEGYFGKPARDLTLAEAALLAGIPQSPARYDPIENPTVARARQQEVLQLMVATDAISPAEAQAAGAEELAFAEQRFDIEAPHFVLGRVADEITARFGPRALYDDGLEVTTTLDLELQNRATDILESWILEYEELSGGHNGAMMAMDHRTGQILVYIGSRDYFRDDIEGRNDNIVALNSPGSTLKPFTYMTAFMEGWSTGTGILDVPTTIVDGATGQDFSPRNPGTGYQGVVTAAQALGNSLNIPALRTILFAGVDETVGTLRNVGFTSLDNPLGYGPALTLGGVDIHLEDLVYGYSVLAAGGTMRGQEAVEAHDPGERSVDPVALLRVQDADGNVLYEADEPFEQHIVSPGMAYLVTSILSDGANQCITFGACGALALPDGRPAAVKTGTSEPFEHSREIGETWAVGYTPQLVAGVWFGNSNNDPMDNIVSTSVSWRAWRDFMVMAHDYLDLPARGFERPPDVVERELCWPSGLLPTDDCPQMNRYTGLFAREVLDRDPDEPGAALHDTWWQPVRIDSRNGLLASETTPERFVRTQPRLVAPPKLDGEKSQPTLNGAGIEDLIAPTTYSSDVSHALRITWPSFGARVSGAVAVLGAADSPSMERYVLEWRQASGSGGWRVINAGSERVTGSAGLLGVFDTSALEPGAYEIRLTVFDKELNAIRDSVVVIVGDAGTPPVAEGDPDSDGGDPPAGVEDPPDDSPGPGRARDRDRPRRGRDDDD